MHLPIVAVGSRGDVQPYLALGLGLQQVGYQVQVCADRLFEHLVASTGCRLPPSPPLMLSKTHLSRLCLIGSI